MIKSSDTFEVMEEFIRNKIVYPAKQKQNRPSIPVNGSASDFAKYAEQLAIWEHDSELCEKKHKAEVEEYSKKYAKATQIWQDKLYAQYGKGLNQKILDLCYSKAYDDGHHAGHEEIRQEFIKVADFASDVMKASQS